jgi:alkaline phosphatase D
MKPALVNADDNWLVEFAELADDLRDAWEHELHDAERQELLRILFAAASRGIGVCILSGDVHTAAAFRMKDKKTGAVLYQLTSSAITYNTPRALSWLLGGLLPDEGSSDDGYDYERLARYTDSNFTLIKADQDNQTITFQIYGKQTAEHPQRQTVLPMTHSLAKLKLDFTD